jgi:transcriptional regulator with XRE-family HTH domain
MAANGGGKATRVANGLSLAEFAQAARLHPTTVHKYEKGLRRPRGAAAERYIRLLDELSK